MATPTSRQASPRTLLASLAASLAIVSSATSFTPMIAGISWLANLAYVALLVAVTGFTVRLRFGPVPTLLAQILVLIGFLTARFTDGGFLKIIPTPTALGELNTLFTTAFSEVRVGLPPIEASEAIVCLMTLGLGGAAILVDSLAVSLRAPAATGLILLCVYAIPTSLSDVMLPWWTFVLCASAFALLLLTARQSDSRAVPHNEVTNPSAVKNASSIAVPVSVVAVALVLALVTGSAITSVDTVGRLPGGRGGQGEAVIGGLGLDPLTSLRGLLNQSGETELFRVQGLGDNKELLRAFTLDEYRPNAGWQLSNRPLVAANPANQPLPLAPGDNGSSVGQDIRIEPINWVDMWLPVYGSPRSLTNVAGDWFYDRERGAVFNEKRQKPPAYTESASLAEPTKQDLRATSGGSDIPAQYTAIESIDPRVVALANDITKNSPTQFDKAAALWEFFTTGGGFTYDTQTAPATDADALADFLLNGKRGFCSQFASAMAVMLRTLGIPARVAVGFTEGTVNGDYRTITSRDAHAWVEAYFGSYGWISFDPTPRSDGRTYSPGYLQNAPETPPSTNTSAPANQPPVSDTPESTPIDAAPIDTAQEDSESIPAWLWWIGIALAVLIILAFIPLTIRKINRRTRTRSVHEHAANAAEAAWRELLDESTDRGKPINAATLRTEADQLARHYRLNETEQQSLNVVVSEVERSWYGPETTTEAVAIDTAFSQLQQRIRQEPLALRAKLLPKSLLRKSPSQRREDI